MNRSMRMKTTLNYLRTVRSTTITSVVNRIKSTSAPQSTPTLDVMNSPDVICSGLDSRVLLLITVLNLKMKTLLATKQISLTQFQLKNVKAKAIRLHMMVLQS